MSTNAPALEGWRSFWMSLDRALAASTAAAAAVAGAVLLFGLATDGMTPLIAVFCMVAFFVAWLHAFVLGVPYAWCLRRVRRYRRMPMMIGGAIIGASPALLMGAPLSTDAYLGLLGAVGAWAFHLWWPDATGGSGDVLAEPVSKPQEARDASPTRVYYNSACPVCRSGVAAHQRAMGACDIEWIDVHANPDAVGALGVDIEAVREKLHVRDADGRVHAGADAFGTLWSRARGLRWLARILAFPGVRGFAQRVYDPFARRLYRWNRRQGRW